MFKLLSFLLLGCIGLAHGDSTNDTDCFKAVTSTSEKAMQEHVRGMTVPEEHMSTIMTLDGGRVEKISPAIWGPSDLATDVQDDNVRAFRSLFTIEYLNLRYNYTIWLPLLDNDRRPIFISLRNVRALSTLMVNKTTGDVNVRDVQVLDGRYHLEFMAIEELMAVDGELPLYLRDRVAKHITEFTNQSGAKLTPHDLLYCQ